MTETERGALEYEMDMFCELWQRLDAQPTEGGFESRYVHDAVVESALLHTRVLAELGLIRFRGQFS